MDHKLVYAILAAFSIFCCTACVAVPQEAQGVSASYPVVPQSNLPQDAALSQTSTVASTITPGEGDKLMEGVLAALPESGVVHVTDEKGSTFQVDASDDAMGQIWDLISAQNYAPLQVTDELFQGKYSTISLRYTADQDYLIKLYGCDQDHPAYAGKTVVDLESHGNGESSFKTYIAGLAAFQEVSTILSRLKNTLTVVLNRQTTLLQTDMGGKGELTSWMQSGNRVMLAFAGDDGAYQQLFAEDTGTLLGTTRVAEPVTRMDMTREESGFDYQMFTASRVIYKNSKDPLTEKAYSLPTDVQPAAWENSGGDFDVKYGKLSWTELDGAYLANTDGSDRRQLLANSELTALAGALAPTGEMKAVAPRLLNEAEQAVIPVAVDNHLVGVVLVDLQNGTKNGYFDVFGIAYQSIVYPDKRSFAAAGEKDVTLVDVTTRETKRLPFSYGGNDVWYSGDYKTFVVGEPVEGALFNSYLVSARKPTDRSREFLKVQGRGGFEVVGASERNLLVYVQDDRGIGYHLVKLSVSN